MVGVRHRKASEITSGTRVTVGRLGSLFYLGRQVSQVKPPAILTRPCVQFAMFFTPSTLQYYKHVVMMVEKFISKVRQQLLVTSVQNPEHDSCPPLLSFPPLPPSSPSLLSPHPPFTLPSPSSPSLLPPPPLPPFLSCYQCGPEYKVPGLYVVDSIVRQSRHQFGAEKDCYGPRFTKNFQKTFQNLFQCSPEDKVCNGSRGIT